MALTEGICARARWARGAHLVRAVADVAHLELRGRAGERRLNHSTARLELVALKGASATTKAALRAGRADGSHTYGGALKYSLGREGGRKAHLQGYSKYSLGREGGSTVAPRVD